MILECHKLTRRIGTRNLVDNVSLSFAQGSLTALIGPNGAGKTTLLRMLSGQSRPSEGQVLLDGKDLSAWPGAALAAKRAFMAQSVSLPFAFTTEDVVALGFGALERQISPAERQTILEEAMERAQVTGFAGRSVQLLSGGEQQRVHFARVLAQLLAGRCHEGRQVLFLDEPVSSLDPLHQIALMRQVRDLALDGLTVIAILHDINLSIACADRLVALKAGRIVGEGAPDDFVTSDSLASLFGLQADVFRLEGLAHPVVVPRLDAIALGHQSENCFKH